jgi:hypothetical protein
MSLVYGDYAVFSPHTRVFEAGNRDLPSIRPDSKCFGGRTGGSRR